MNKELSELKSFLESIKRSNPVVIESIDEAVDVIFTEGAIGSVIKTLGKPLAKAAKTIFKGGDEALALAKAEKSGLKAGKVAKTASKAEKAEDLAKAGKKAGKGSKKGVLGKIGGMVGSAALGAGLDMALGGDEEVEETQPLESRHANGYQNARRWPTNFYIGSLDENQQREVDDLATLSYRNKRDNSLSDAELSSVGNESVEYDAQKRFLEVYDYGEDIWNLGEPVAYEQQMR